MTPAVFAINTSITCSILFFFLLIIILIPNLSIFFKSHGRRHRLVGLMYLIWLILGLYDALFVLFNSPMHVLYYDIIFGMLGIILTITAAEDFQHKSIKNVASGTLDVHSTVTYNEMIEHSFYQGLNLCQIIYIHSITLCTSKWIDTIYTMVSTYIYSSYVIVAPYIPVSTIYMYKYKI